ncbi:MAG: Polyribonucleotide nucleotidyltransferase [Chlamydiae bacterium]|nr:Polyribonucleotide nucleotidyltransferase [Chlamydiota bacterium]
MKRNTITVPLGDQEITFETGKVAKQANGSVIVKMGETIVFATACAADKPTEGLDFLPLQVHYQEKFSSAGKTLGGYLKREGRPSEREILTSRLIDRPIRPMFEEGYCCETQVLAYVWSYDGVHSPGPLALCAAAAALVISDIPLVKPIGAVRVGMVEGKFVVNPTIAQQQVSTLDLLMAGTEDAVLMIEGYCDFLTEEQVLEAIEFGHGFIKDICHALAKWREEVGKPKNRDGLRPPVSDEIKQTVYSIMEPKLASVLRIKDKLERETAQSEMKKEVMDKFFPEGEESEHDPLEISTVFKKIQADYLRKMVLNENLRCDGRKTTDIRFIDIEQGLLPRVHGSSLFTRGETQSMAVCTLGGETMAQRYETLDGDGSRRFYLQYSFPPFSVGEVRRMGPPGRREIGHGKLAERALSFSLPDREKFPYTIRLESNITESNGSSSMASVCGGCLALMNAGVPIKRPVSGIAMGLILEGKQFAILSDILGIEDSLGDMDFKITGDGDGITAFQMDIKVEGITVEIMAAALKQAREGRIHILNKMLEVAPTYATEMSIHAPRIASIKVKISQIGAIIGPGGSKIREIMAESGAEIDINDDGIVNIAAPGKEGLDIAIAMVEGLTAEVEIGKIYEGLVKKIMPFGIFVEILPGKEGLCHISEYDNQRIEDLNDVVKEKQTVTVKVLDINDRGQIKLSRKATLVKSNN